MTQNARKGPMTVDELLCPPVECTGCAACANACSVGSISMDPDGEGFASPRIDPERCTGCGACSKACPVLHPAEVDPARIPRVYACWLLDDETRRQSASGGAFSAFAEHVLRRGGVVFGAAFDEALVLHHEGVASKELLGRLRSSKYMQSHIGTTLRAVRRLLRGGRPVLFVGTPCQVAGLYSFLGTNRYPGQLLTCDLVCYGVPPQMLFHANLDYLARKHRVSLKKVLFRQKGFGSGSCTVAVFGDGRKKILTGRDFFFGLGFASGLFFRNCCYDCRYSTPSRVSDLTLGDFWGIHTIPGFAQEAKRGVSLVLVHGEAGQEAFEACKDRLFYEERTWAEATLDPRAQMIIGSARRNPQRDQFFRDWGTLPLEEILRRYFPVKLGIREIVRSVIGTERYLRLKEILGK